MRKHHLLFLAACLSLLTACDTGPHELRFVTPTESADRSIVEEFSDLLDDEASVRIGLTATPLSEEAALDALQSGDADVALVSNYLPFRSDIATVMPLYPTVLHIGRREGASELHGLEKLRGALIYAGPEGSASRLVFEDIAESMNLGSDEYRYVGSDEVPDIVIVFSPILPHRKEIRDLRQEFPDFELSTMGTPQDIGTGGIIDAAVLANPHFQPFVIPVGIYGELTSQPVVTVAVDKILVARSDLDGAVVYDLINEILRLRPALAAKRPGLFQQLSGDFDTSRSTYIVHAGTQAYLQRSAPTVYERYSGVAEVLVTLLVAVVSASIAAVRIFRMRRKNRIDTFYTQTIALRRSVTDSTGPDELAQVIREVRALQNTAFDLLVDEKLAADESFRIFITLSNDVLRQLGDISPPLRASDA
ncbi:MAG: TAXI family TRAP transporter solute-binding subunit [Woeseiaceae bacterium]